MRKNLLLLSLTLFMSSCAVKHVHVLLNEWHDKWNVKHQVWMTQKFKNDSLVGIQIDTVSSDPRRRDVQSSGYFME